MTLQDQHSLFSSLDLALETLERNRTPDPRLVAAYDTLKQARAKLVQAVREGAVRPAREVLVAA